MVTRHMPPGCQDMQGPTWHHLESIFPPPRSSSYSGSDVGTGEDRTDTSADTGLRSNFKKSHLGIRCGGTPLSSQHPGS